MFLGYNQYWPGGFLVLCFLCPGATEDSTGSGSGFKASQKTGLQSHPTNWEKPGIEHASGCDPGLQDIGLSPLKPQLSGLIFGRFYSRYSIIFPMPKSIFFSQFSEENSQFQVGKKFKE